MPVSDYLVNVYVHLVVGLLGNKVVEPDELLVVLLNPDVGLVKSDMSSQKKMLTQNALKNGV